MIFDDFMGFGKGQNISFSGLRPFAFICALLRDICALLAGRIDLGFFTFSPPNIIT